METPLSADPAALTPAVLAPGSATVKSLDDNLRAALATAINAKQDAAARAAEAMRISDRAADAERDAAAEVARLKAERDAEQAQATRTHAEACTAALRTGEALPPAPAYLETHSPALAVAAARLNALQQSAGQLADESAVARNIAAEATAACRDIIDRIIIADARAIAAEWIAAVQLSWRLQDQLTGLARIGDGSLLPHDFQTELLSRIDRRKVAVAENSLMIERPNFDGYLDGLSADQERAWLDYGRRLMDDSDAAFDAEGLPQ